MPAIPVPSSPERTTAARSTGRFAGAKTPTDAAHKGGIYIIDRLGFPVVRFTAIDHPQERGLFRSHRSARSYRPADHGLGIVRRTLSPKRLSWMIKCEMILPGCRAASKRIRMVGASESTASTFSIPFEHLDTRLRHAGFGSLGRKRSINFVLFFEELLLIAVGCFLQSEALRFLVDVLGKNYPNRARSFAGRFRRSY